jgi:hypothetical protein
MTQPAEEKTEKARPARLEMVDLIFLAGLVFILVGLGLQVGWGWGLFVDGVIMVGVGIWAVKPSLPAGGNN